MKTLTQIFEKQLKNNYPITKEILDKMHNKTYHSGREIKDGDIVLSAMLVGNVIEKINEYPELPIELIFINEKDFDKYEPYDNQNNITIPRIKMKE